MAIHKYIFDDIYPFAGKYRRVNMSKQIDMTNQCIEVALDLFGQETIVEVGFDEVEKV